LNVNRILIIFVLYTIIQLTLPEAIVLAVLHNNNNTSNNSFNNTKTVSYYKKDFIIGYHFGKKDAAVGIKDSPGSCGLEQGVQNTTSCTIGYDKAFNTYCKKSKYGCSE
jgi:hypothetical protein